MTSSSENCFQSVWVSEWEHSKRKSNVILKILTDDKHCPDNNSSLDVVSMVTYNKEYYRSLGEL